MLGVVVEMGGVDLSPVYAWFMASYRRTSSPSDIYPSRANSRGLRRWPVREEANEFEFMESAERDRPHPVREHHDRPRVAELAQVRCGWGRSPDDQWLHVAPFCVSSVVPLVVGMVVLPVQRRMLAN